MVFSQRSRLVLAHWAIITLVVMFLQGAVSGFISKWLPFLSALGRVGSFIVTFLAIIFLIGLTDFVSEKALGL